MAVKKSTKASLTKREVQQPIEQAKLQGINWDFLAPSSALTLIITVALFMIGWAYISNWYRYFGIDTNLINIPFQQTLIYSIQPLLIILPIITALIILFPLMRRIERLGSMLLDNHEWILILGLAHTLLLALNYLNSRLMFDISSPTSLDLYYQSLPIEIEGSNIFGGIIVLFSLFLLIALNIPGFRLNRLSMVEKRYWLVLMSFALFLDSLSFSATIAMGTASRGNRPTGGHMQLSVLVSPKRLDILDTKFELSCDKNSCTYGYFYLVAETAQSYYMIEMPVTGIPFHPELFIFPRNDQNGTYFIVPVSAVNYSPNSSP